MLSAMPESAAIRLQVDDLAAASQFGNTYPQQF
jgi:hypothetical protein